ncbi:hypothetical protein K439DRAFT_716941 [Ramaria rubella]|nr:hypothetical protein K439DRAFT_716941 [Ramaria rubella]
MKLSIVPIILSAGLAISQVSAAPLRVVVVSQQFSGPNGVVRVGNASQSLSNANVATMHSVGGMKTKSRPGCAGSLRAKAKKVSNWFRVTFGLPVTFVQRLSHALMMLGPWEGRAVSFILGCGIGVLIRMFWVLAVLAIRSVKGKKQEEEFLGDEVLYEEEEHLLPPQYVVEEKSEPVRSA